MTSADASARRGEKLAAVFRDKPEMVIHFPEWMLSRQQIREYRGMQDLAIVEIAGRDSVAAAVLAASQNGYSDLLPVYAYTGTEYGSWNNVEQAVCRLARRLPETRVHPLVMAGSPAFWRALNGRFISDCVKVFGHYTPCPGCHLYLHSVRIPLARMLGNAPVIAGERISHSGMIKINQVSQALNFYAGFLKAFNIRLDLPLADIAEGEKIEEILQTPWKRGKDQLSCCLSGNYKTSAAAAGLDTRAVMRYFTEFAGPAAQRILDAYLDNQVPDHEQMADQAMARCVT